MAPSSGSIPASTLADRLARQANQELAYVRRMERSFLAGAVKPHDVLRVYAGGYLTFYTKLERTIEDLFIELLTGKMILTAQSTRVLVRVSSRSVARAVINGTRAYSDWLPFDQHTLKRAPAFFADGKPFQNVSSADKRLFEDAGVIRNAIAHGSEFSLQKFQKRFTLDQFGGFNLPPQQRRPAGYLRGIHAGRQTRLDYRVTELVAAVQRLCS